MLQQQRIQCLNTLPVRKKGSVIYWMQASQRVEYNHALEYAVRQANISGKQLVVCFFITDDYPGANLRHYSFMLEGLRETQEALRERNIKMLIIHGSPEVGIVEMSRYASFIVVDCVYTRIQRYWRDYAAQHLSCLLVQVETDVIVPVTDASDKEEYAARTIRSRIHRKLPSYLFHLDNHHIKKSSLNLDFNIETIDLSNMDEALKTLKIDRSVLPTDFVGGSMHAKFLLDEFINRKLDRYEKDRNDPNLDSLSKMSLYLHFGQISPLYITTKIRESGSPGMKTYLEELIIRRELSMNFLFYNKNYDNYAGLPQWCKKTLDEHRNDPREFLYNREELEKGKTHDPYWNAAQMQMTETGKMHGYMRMYWGKKILEWMKSPEEAFDTALFLNDKYELDGRDPNGYTGVAWCFGKHDRPWKERNIFGKVRYMNDRGLKRKFDADGYVKMVNQVMKQK